LRLRSNRSTNNALRPSASWRSRVLAARSPQSTAIRMKKCSFSTSRGNPVGGFNLRIAGPNVVFAGVDHIAALTLGWTPDNPTGSVSTEPVRRWKIARKSVSRWGSNIGARAGGLAPAGTTRTLPIVSAPIARRRVRAACGIVSRSESYRAGVSRRVQAGGGCRGCLAGCGAWVTARCCVDVAVCGCRGDATGVVDARRASRCGNQRGGILRSGSLPICPARPSGRDGSIGRRGLALAIRRRLAGPRTGQWTAAGTPPARPDYRAGQAGGRGSSGSPIHPYRGVSVRRKTPVLRGQDRSGRTPSRTHFCSLIRNG
jgi:hypothetical protein